MGIRNGGDAALPWLLGAAQTVVMVQDLCSCGRATEAYEHLLRLLAETYQANAAVLFQRSGGDFEIRAEVVPEPKRDDPVRWDIVRMVSDTCAPVVVGAEEPGNGQGLDGWSLLCMPIENGRAVLYAHREGPWNVNPADHPEGLRGVASLFQFTMRMEAIAGAGVGKGSRSRPNRGGKHGDRHKEDSLAGLPPARSDRLSDLFPEIIGTSPGIARVLDMIDKFAGTDLSILIEGESGTGKELVARAIHRRSRRADHTFVSENCGALPESLLESEFFGHEKGAFTGADRPKAGLLELAHEGTLFLDEIAEMSLDLQKKLLRVLQEREMRRIGGHRAIRVDFRLVSATNRILDELVREGKFREDLFYRVNVVRIAVPPLRERRGDIPPLIDHFLKEVSQGRPGPPIRIGEEALDVCLACDWPGNVRELRNEILRAAVLADREIGLDHLSPAMAPARLGKSPRRGFVDYGRSLPDVERQVIGSMIRDALSRSRGNKAQAARLLGIPKSTLYHRLHKYGIEGHPRRRRSGKGHLHDEPGRE